jgi:tRNA 2-thiouridine synthesizing protein C
MTKNILVIQRTAPYGSSLGREGLDYVLTSAAYDQNISLLFLGDGAFQLLSNQQSKHINLKNQLSALEVLPLYDIENLYVTQEDLSERNLSQSQLGIKVIVIKRADVHNLIEQQDHVVGF